MMEIRIKSGRVIVVDAADYEAVAQYRWVAMGPAKMRRPYRHRGRAEGGGNVSLGSFLMNPPAGMIVDHINGDPWDNRRANLRICTRAENVRNSAPRKGKQFKGVYFDKRARQIYSTIRIDGKVRYLGGFDTHEEAARAYDRAALGAWGEFARLNFPDDSTRDKYGNFSFAGAA